MDYKTKDFDNLIDKEGRGKSHREKSFVETFPA